MDIPTARLIVIDYAESRVEQLKLLLPLLVAHATVEAPVRLLLLVRAAPRRTTDWTERLRNRNRVLDSLLDDCEVRVLEDLPLEVPEREALFEAAASAFAARADPTAFPPLPPKVLEEKDFASPLLVVIAAYLAVHGNPAPPSNRAALLDEVLEHEQNYWLASASDLFRDEVLPRRVVGLATLAGAETEAEAAELLRLLPDLEDAPAERRLQLARWVHDQYQGPRWWNPLEPDLVGEHLVAEDFSDQAGVLAGVLGRKEPNGITQPLGVYARAAADHPQLAAALQPILSTELERLCGVAVTQAATEADHDLLYGNASTAAAAVDRAIAVVEVDPVALPNAVALMPPRPDLLLSPLALSLTAQDVAYHRRLAAAEPAVHEPGLATLLTLLSIRLADVGRHEEGVVASEESVERCRRLTAASPATYELSLADSLTNLSLCLAATGRHEEGMAAIEEAVEVYRRLAAADPPTYEPKLALSLTNLSNRLADVGRHEEGVVASEESVEVRRRLAVADSATYEPKLALSLANLSNRLAATGRHEEGLAASEESVEVYRRLAGANPAAYEPGLAGSLANLSLCLAATGRHEEGLAASEESVEVYRRLAGANPAAYEPGLARSLKDLLYRLAGVGRRGEGIAEIEEAVEIYRRLIAANPTAHEPGLASSLNNLSICLDDVGRHEEAERVRRELADLSHRRADGASPSGRQP